MSKKLSQREIVIKHVEKHGSINALEAIRMYGITRLAARICELRDGPHAMKATIDESVAPGFVTYVPDLAARKRNRMKGMYRRMDGAYEYLQTSNPDMSIVAKIFTDLAVEAHRAANA